MVCSIGDAGAAHRGRGESSQTAVQTPGGYDGSGYCYLSIVQDKYREEIGKTYGEWPYIEEVLRLSILKLDGAKLFASHLVRNGSLWHFTDNGGLRANEVFRAAACRAREVYEIGSIGASYQVTAGLVQPSLLKVGEHDRIGGDTGFISPELFELHKLDFSQCRCKIHSVPATTGKSGFTVGCVQKPAGKASVIADAYAGKPGMCHADLATRACDKKFLEHVISDCDPGLLSGSSRPASFDELCTSSESTDLAAFGNGYCYLSLLHKDTWWRVARLLGPNPSLRSLRAFLPWAGKPSSKPHKLLRVADGYYHVVEDKTVKGISNTAGASMVDEISRIVEQWPDAKVGAWAYRPNDPSAGPKCADVGNFKKRVVDIALRRTGGDHGVIWLENSRDGCNPFVFPSTLDVLGSGLLEYVDEPPDCAVGDNSGIPATRFSAVSESRAAVVLPEGWYLTHRGVVYGSPKSSVVFAFRGHCDAQITPSVRGVIGRLILITGSRLEWALDRLLHPKSTDARFVRDCEASVVLAFPSGSSGKLLAVPDWNVVPITDPLEDWCAIREIRLESRSVGKDFHFNALSLTAFKSFRSNCGAEFIIDDFVRLSEPDVAVIVTSGDRRIRVKYTYTIIASGDDWSVRYLVCADPYCMDDGGPSGSDFSDAI